jgi:ORF6N domain
VASAPSSKSQIVISSPEVAALDLPSKVLEIRGHRVLLSPQLALLYEVEPRVLMQQVQRNIERFPADFMFQLNAEEFDNLKSQFVTSSWGGIRKLPFAFTEQGVAMLSSVLRSERAVAVNIEIMRTFVKLRGMLAEHSDLKRKLTTLEKKYDENFKVVFQAIAQLMDEPGSGAYGNRRIGFTQDSKDK